MEFLELKTKTLKTKWWIFAVDPEYTVPVIFKFLKMTEPNVIPVFSF